MTKKILFFGIVAYIIAAGGSVLLLISPKEESGNISVISTKEPTTEMCSAFKIIKNTYCDGVYRFVLHYPESYKAEVNPYVNDVLFTKGNQEIQVYAESGENICYLNLCDRTAVERKTYNGVTWDFLGPVNYCDGDASGGGCDMKDVFRTKNKVGTIYIQSTSRTEIERMIKTFRYI